uniref:GG25029 n=1 Tax=Drosophila erecta TaxID=7220 RepID=B3NYQ2_DROER
MTLGPGEIAGAEDADASASADADAEAPPSWRGIYGAKSSEKVAAGGNCGHIIRDGRTPTGAPAAVGQRLVFLLRILFIAEYLNVSEENVSLHDNCSVPAFRKRSSSSSSSRRRD